MQTIFVGLFNRHESEALKIPATLLKAWPVTRLGWLDRTLCLEDGTAFIQLHMDFILIAQ